MREVEDQDKSKKLDYYELHHAQIVILKVSIGYHFLEEISQQRHRRTEPGGVQIDRDQNPEPGQVDLKFSMWAFRPPLVLSSNVFNRPAKTKETACLQAQRSLYPM